MTPKEKLLKQIEELDCGEIYCKSCPLFKRIKCEKHKFQEICRERFEPKCGQELKGWQRTITGSKWIGSEKLKVRIKRWKQ